MSTATIQRNKQAKGIKSPVLVGVPRLLNGDHVELKPRSDGVIRSRVFPRLWLDVRALVAGYEDRVSRVLEKGLRSAEHAAFVKRLAGKITL